MSVIALLAHVFLLFETMQLQYSLQIMTVWSQKITNSVHDSVPYMYDAPLIIFNRTQI